MSDTELNAFFRLEFYKKQHNWVLQPRRRRPQSEPSATSPPAGAVPPAVRTPRGLPSRTSLTHAPSESQLNTTYSVGDAGDGDAPVPLPSPRFVDDFVDSWVHAASSCSARDAEADGLAPLEPEPEFVWGAGAAPHSSELNLCPPPAHPPPPHEHYLALTADWAVLPDEADGGVPAIPMECDLSRPPPPLPAPRAPHPAPAPSPTMLLPAADKMPAPYGNFYEPDPCCDPELPDYPDGGGTFEWDEEALNAAIESEGRAALAHAQRGRDLLVLRNRLAPSQPPPCPLCGGPTPPAPRGRGRLPRPLDVGQWARGQAACMLVRYP